MTTHRWVPLLALSFGLVCAGCGSSGGTSDPVGAEVVRSAKARITTPDAPSADVAAVGESNRAFAFELYHQLRTEDGNLFLSPYSVSVALAMTYAGARGDTAAQMRDVLHFIDEARLHPAMNAVDLALASRGDDAHGSDDGPFRLDVVNATWGQTGYPFQPAYVDVLGEQYGAAMYLLDFMNGPEGARALINAWVEDRTEQRIRDLIPMGAITSLTRLVLTNAVYFNAAWNEPFDPSDTHDGAFTRLDGTTATAPMMSQHELHPYGEGDGYAAVELEYDAPELSMVLVLPDAGRFDEIEAAFDESTYAELEATLREHSVELTMPTFEYEVSFSLKDTLVALGMIAAFEPGTADFSGMDGSHDLYIQAVLHKAFIRVDEAGTEAAAATAVISGATGIPDPAAITLDRPFLYFIIDHPTGQILFLGRVLDPSP